jgi:hypothetical protein
MAQPADPKSVIDAISKTRSESAHASREGQSVLDATLSAPWPWTPNGGNPIAAAWHHIDILGFPVPPLH